MVIVVILYICLATFNLFPKDPHKKQLIAAMAWELLQWSGFDQSAWENGVIYKTGMTIGLFLIGLSSASANLITNGDFETGDFSGWTQFTTSYGTTSGVSGAPNVVSFATTSNETSLAAKFGVGALTYVATQQGGGIFQSFLTGSGAISITVDIAAFDDGFVDNVSAGIFTLLLDSVVVDTFDFDDISRYQPIERGSLAFSGAVGAGSHELRILITRVFLTPNYLSQYVDNVNVTMAAVPEPATLALFGLGLTGLGFIRRRKA